MLNEPYYLAKKKKKNGIKRSLKLDYVAIMSFISFIGKNCMFKNIFNLVLSTNIVAKTGHSMFFYSSNSYFSKPFIIKLETFSRILDKFEQESCKSPNPHLFFTWLRSMTSQQLSKPNSSYSLTILCLQPNTKMPNVWAIQRQHQLNLAL